VLDIRNSLSPIGHKTVLVRRRRYGLATLDLSEDREAPNHRQWLVRWLKAETADGSLRDKEHA
jgi:hypothetical protein